MKKQTKKTTEPAVEETKKVEPAKVEEKPKEEKQTANMYSADSMASFVDNYFLSQRAVWLDTDIDSELCSYIVKQLNLWLDGTKLPVYIFINSPGGSMHVASAIVDTMKALEAAGSKVYTINVALAASAAAIVFSAGTKGCRFAYPSSRVMFKDALVENSKHLNPKILKSISVNLILQTKCSCLCLQMHLVCLLRRSKNL